MPLSSALGLGGWLAVCAFAVASAISESIAWSIAYLACAVISSPSLTIKHMCHRCIKCQSCGRSMHEIKQEDKQ